MHSIDQVDIAVIGAGLGGAAAMALLGPWGVSRSVPGHVRHALGMDADGGATATSSA